VIKLIDILKESVYPFSKYDILYDEDDNSLLVVEYTFDTKENEYKVIFDSKEKKGEFSLSFGLDVGNFNKIDTFQITGEGDARNILQTVAEIMNTFYKQYSKDIDKIIVSGTSEKRNRVYKAFLPKYLKPEVLAKTEIE
jgi:hypothetical protein